MPVRVIFLDYQWFCGIYVEGNSLEVFSTIRFAFQHKFESLVWWYEIKVEANSALSYCRGSLVRDESVSSDVDNVDQQRRFLNLACTRHSKADLGTLTLKCEVKYVVIMLTIK